MFNRLAAHGTDAQGGAFVRRIDLHCHSRASTEAGEAVLNALQCPESYSEPAEVYAEAKRRGMDFVTITDHDTLNGVATMLHLPDVLTGEELTCYFPEDQCKMHVLVWGLNAEDHRALQAMAADIYKVADYLADHQLAHSVAHPLYRQNDRLEKWHVERLILLFKGFETLNGAHSPLHRDAFEPLLDDLTSDRVAHLAAVHSLSPRWPAPHVKARTGGSDDHGLFNIGRTWTEFPEEVATTQNLLDALRRGRCRPGGEAGSSLKLAHNFYSVGVRYYTRQILTPDDSPTITSIVMKKLVGERQQLRKRDVARLAIRHAAKSVRNRLWPRRQPTGVALLGDLFTNALRSRLTEHPALKEALAENRPPLAEHEQMFSMVSGLNGDITRGLADAVAASLSQGKIGGLFDAISTVAAHQFVMLPYYFAFFHQNRERHHFARITGRAGKKDFQSLRVGLFTDTFDEINGVARFVRDMSDQANGRGCDLTVHTCVSQEKFNSPSRKNFKPLFAQRFPLYPDLPFNLPPVADILEWADRKQFDAIHIDTPGPMGLCGLLVSKMLRIPALGTYHTDFPAYVNHFTGDHRLTVTAEGYMSWFFGSMQHVFSRTRRYEFDLRKIGLRGDRISMTLPGVDAQKFNPTHRQPDLWQKLGVSQPYRVLFCGRVSLEKNLPLLVEAFGQICRNRRDVALVIAGDGPYRNEMQARLAGLPAYFLGYQNDAQLGALYASSDLFVFPSRTDTLGQVVIEAQSCGLPVLVSDEGGPREVMDDQVTGIVLPGADATAWAKGIERLLDDDALRQRMSRTAPQRMSRFCLAKTFEAFWDRHVAAANATVEQSLTEPVAHPGGVADSVY
ncbi:MAG TPA: glycosyltransferase [Tepidisphaeraceae bacterium]|nr:glycosyltransferase [Tepidisphaeraceae bacterium]